MFSAWKWIHSKTTSPLDRLSYDEVKSHLQHVDFQFLVNNIFLFTQVEEQLHMMEQLSHAL